MVTESWGERVDLPSFVFCIQPEEVAAYREALGAPGVRVPFGMAVRALMGGPLASAVQDIARGRHVVHLSQDCVASLALCPGIDYVCNVHLQTSGDERLRIEQSLVDPSGCICLKLMSEIALVAA